MKAKKQTAGEKFGRKWQLNNWAIEALDALVRRAVREAYEIGTDINNPSCSLKLASERKARIERKYGVRL